MRGSLLLCLAGAATSFVWEPRLLAMVKSKGKAAARAAELEARPLSGYKPPGEESEEWTPEEAIW